MGKRDIFEDNILNLTRSKALKNALKGWEVRQIVDLSKDDSMATCELCGTHFRKGVLARHPKVRATVTVGGTCVEALLLGRFPDKKKLAKRKRAVTSLVRQSYADVVDPGAWKTWVIENAPKRYAASVAELRYLGTITSDDGLQQLIRFHNKTRLYPRDSLLPEWKQLQNNGAKMIPKELTLDQARQILRKATPEGLTKARIERARSFKKRSFREVGGELAELWRKLNVNEKRTLVALLSLGECFVEREGEICKRATSASWKLLATPYDPPLFAWHTKVGAGIVWNKADPSGMVDVLVWSGGGRESRRFRLDKWLVLDPPSDAALRKLEKEAFGSVPEWFF
jgi:hypothetical protein